jgi:hypothetical protein
LLLEALEQIEGGLAQGEHGDGSECCGCGVFTRHANVPGLRHYQKGKNRPFQYGAHASGSAGTTQLWGQPNHRLTATTNR